MYRRILWTIALTAWAVAADQPPDTYVVRRAALTRTLTFSGDLESVEAVTLTAPSSSKSSSMAITFMAPEGTFVQAGDPVLEFDVTALEVERLELEKKKEDARIKIAQKESEVETRRQDLLLERATAEKTFQVAQLYVGIDRSLIPRADAEKYQFDLQNGGLELKKVNERLQTLEQSSEAELEVLRLEYEEADLKLHRIHTELNRMQIRAPISGLVIYGQNPSRGGKLQIGDMVWTGWPVMMIPSMQQLSITTYVYDMDFPLLREGLPAEIVLDAVPGRSFRGELVLMAEVAQPREFRSQLKAFQAEVLLRETDLSVMKPGMTARVRIPVERSDGLLVPRPAVQVAADGAAFVLKSRRPSEPVAVTILDASETHLLVTGDLQEGDQLTVGTSSTRRPSASVDWLPVKREGLLFSVSGTGILTASESVTVGPPPLSDYWRFKITRMVPEGTRVSQGDFLLAFDPSETQKNLRQETAALEKVQEELEKARASLELQLKDLEMQLEEARVQRERADNKLLLAREFESNLAVQEADFEARLARERVQILGKKLESVKQNVALQLEILVDTATLHRHRIAAYEHALKVLTLEAPISGVVIYETNWNNEKKTVGSDVFRMEMVMSIPRLESLIVEGQVAEVDAAKLKLGQKVNVTLDALPDRTFRGQVTRLGTILRHASYDRPIKVLEIGVELERIDTQVMRPGMAARLAVVLDEFKDVLAVPLSVLEVEGNQSFAWVRSMGRVERREVRVGEDNGIVAIVEEGLKEGEEVASRPLGSVKGGLP